MFRKTSLSIKMILGFSIPLIITVCIVIGIYTITKKVEVNARLAKDESVVYAGIAKQMKLDVVQVQQWLSDISATRAQDGLDDGFDEAQESAESFKNGLGQFAEMYARENDQPSMEKLNELESAFEKYYQVGVTMAQAYIEGGPAAGNKTMASFDEAAENMSGLLEPFVEQQLNELNTVMNDTVASVKFLRTAVVFAGIFSLVTGILLSWVLIRSITKPINEIIEGMREGAEQVAAASGQVSSSSQHLAEGSSGQAASIEETSSSLEEMSAMTMQNSDNAHQADNLMKEAYKVVSQANNSMSELTNSMDEIFKASEETSKIIKTIDEIAFQTNLLALNAAVEAARAGEAGAGFAVVADEVRNLAIRAADAAKDTANLIETTVQKIQDGNTLVANTNEAFGAVEESASKVGELVGEIAAASNEQSEGIGLVNNAVNEMDKVVQQNAANAEESASASEELSAQADQMKTIVNQLVFLVKGANIKERIEINSEQSLPKNFNKFDNSTEQSIAMPAEAPVINYNNQNESIPMEDEDFKDF